MRSFISSYANRQKYRPASIALLLGAILPYLSPAIGLEAGWILLAFAAGMICFIGLVTLTFYRFRNAGLSIWWLALFIVTFHFGPEWELGYSINFRPIGIISLIPVLLGWFTSQDAAAAKID